MTSMFSQTARFTRAQRFFVMLLCFFIFRSAVPRAAAAQNVYSNQSTVTLNMNVSKSVTIVPSSVSLPPFTYTNGAATSGT